MIESAYSKVDQNGLRKKVQAVTMQPVTEMSTSKTPITATLPPPTIASSYLTVNKSADKEIATPLTETQKQNPAEISGNVSELDKVGGITQNIIAPAASAGLSIYQRSNAIAKSTKEADALGIKTTMDLAGAGGKIGSMFGPVGGLVGTATGGVIGAIYSGIRSKHDKKVQQRRKQKEYTASLVKTAAERDRDNLMQEAQDSIGAEQNLIKQQIGIIG